MPQQRIDTRFAPTESHEQVHGILAAACFENVFEEAASGFGIEDAAFLEERKGVAGQYLGRKYAKSCAESG